MTMGQDDNNNVVVPSRDCGQELVLMTKQLNFTPR